MATKSLTTYARLCTEFYDLEHHPRHAEALKFYMKHALQADGPILEPMCGTGRFLIPMLQAGLDVEGFDASVYMLDALRQKYVMSSDKAAPVWQQFVQEFSTTKRYHLIFIPYGSWGLITDLEQARQGLQRLYDHLVPGGTLLVEIETVSSVPQPCGIWRRASHTRQDSSILALSFITSYQADLQLFQSYSRYESIVNNKIEAQEQELFEQYLYRVDEFDSMLHDVGFTHIKKYPAFDESQEVTSDTPMIVYECIK